MSRALGPLGIQHFNLGLSSQRASKTIYTYEDEITTGHASIYKEALTVPARLAAHQGNRNQDHNSR